MIASPISLRKQSILYVTAHPDDEAMFFGPSIIYATDPTRNNSVSLLCLSTGNDQGLGEVRSSELINAAEILGISGANVTIINDEKRLPDSMVAEWNPSVIISYLSKEVEKTGATTLITFDDGGVSGHTNHKQVSLAVQEYAKGKDIKVYMLKSVSLFRKYMAHVDAIITRILDKKVFIVDRAAYSRICDAMVNAHHSQMVWFRYIWITMSRYMYCNDFERL